MSYIIIWRHSHRSPFVDDDDRGFLETYQSFEAAKESAETTIENMPNDPHYHDYKIYEEVTS